MTHANDDIRKFINLLIEATAGPDTPQAKDPTPDRVEKDREGSVDDTAELLTKPAPLELEGNVNFQTLADKLNIKNVNLFRQAFNKLKRLEPNKDLRTKLTQNEMAELTYAFYQLLAADSRESQLILNNLRQIHSKKPR